MLKISVDRIKSIDYIKHRFTEYWVLGSINRSLFYGFFMLNREITDNSLFKEIKNILDTMGYICVDVKRSEHLSSLRFSIVIYCSDRAVTVDDCANVYNSLFLRLSAEFQNREIELEISTPGLQRNIRDVWEFEVFQNKILRIYDSETSAWIHGKNEKYENNVLFLSSWENEDTKEKGDMIKLEYSQIVKAKLHYSWEDK